MEVVERQQLQVDRAVLLVVLLVLLVLRAVVPPVVARCPDLRRGGRPVGVVRGGGCGGGDRQAGQRCGAGEHARERGPCGARGSARGSGCRPSR